MALECVMVGKQPIGCIEHGNEGIVYQKFYQNKWVMEVMAGWWGYIHLERRASV
jgi:hypothetical protein